MSETTLVALPDGAGVFPGTQYELTPGNYTAINNIVSQQNANNTSLRTSINACATTPVPSSQLDPTTIQYATVALALADILALHATPKVLVAAPGAGKLLEFISAWIEFVYGSAAFTIGSATNMSIKYKTDASGIAASGTLAATGFWDQTANTAASFLAAAAAATATTALLNQALALTVAVADMTVGTGGSGIVKVAYRVHSGLS